MTIEQIIDLLQTSGINSKKKVIEMLQTDNQTEWLELEKDCQKMGVRCIAKKLERKNNNE